MEQKKISAKEFLPDWGEIEESPEHQKLMNQDRYCVIAKDGRRVWLPESEIEAFLLREEQQS